MATETAQTLDRGLRVLTILAATPGGLTVTEISTRLEINRTVVYRLVSTLGVAARMVRTRSPRSSVCAVSVAIH